MSLRDYWQAVRRRWPSAVLCVLLTVGLAALITSNTPAVYQSTARVFITTASQPDLGTAVQGNNFVTQRVASYVQLVKGGTLAAEVSEALGGELTAQQLRGSVDAAVVPDTVLIDIIVSNGDPFLARDIADAYAESLAENVSRIETPPGRKNPLVTVSLAEIPQVSQTPVSPNPSRNLGLGALLGLLLGVGVAILRELLDNTVKSATDVADVTAAPILAQVQLDPAAAKKDPFDALSDSSPWAEAFRVLRTNMQYVEVDEDRRVFVVSSALPGEGKTTCSVNLAIALAMAGQSVALVECDLRRPRVGKALKLDEALGTTSVLIGQVTIDDAMQEYGSTGLKVLTSGPRPPNPSELLQSRAMDKLLSDLRGRFDVVIMDAPPLLPVTDAALVSAKCDGLLLITRHGKTTRDQLSHAVERIEQVGARGIGVVVNQCPTRRGNLDYGYGYGYSHKYSAAAGDVKVGDPSVRSERRIAQVPEAGTSTPSRRGRRRGKRA